MVSSATNSMIQAMLTPARVGAEISTAVAGKTLDTARQQGQQMVSLIESAGQVATGGEIGPGDPLVARAAGLGSLVDVYA